MFICRASLAQNAAPAHKPDTPAVAQWKALVSEIQKTLEESDEGNCRGAPAPEIVDAFALKSERLSVALVNYCSAGAYTDSVIAMFMDQDRPVRARFRGADGQKLQGDFLSGGSVMHSRFAKLVAEKKAIYDCFMDNDNGGKVSACGVRAYVWNAQSRTFDLNNRLSKTASAEYCRRMRAEYH